MLINRSFRHLETIKILLDHLLKVMHICIRFSSKEVLDVLGVFRANLGFPSTFTNSWFDIDRDPSIWILHVPSQNVSTSLLIDTDLPADLQNIELVRLISEEVNSIVPLLFSVIMVRAMRSMLLGLGCDSCIAIPILFASSIALLAHVTN